MKAGIMVIVGEETWVRILKQFMITPIFTS